jgi:hypothetical protein
MSHAEPERGGRGCPECAYTAADWDTGELLEAHLIEVCFVDSLADKDIYRAVRHPVKLP